MALKFKRTLAKKSYLCAAIAAATMLMAPAAVAANLVLDGDFNNSISGFTTFSGGSTLPGGPWVVTGNSVDLVGNYWQSPSGPTPPNGSVDLNGGAQGGVEQTISGLTSGATYNLTFFLSGNPDGPPTTKSVDVSIGSLVNDNFTYTIGTNTHANMMYVQESVNFTAGASNTLSFASQNAGAFGPVIGGVSISAVPEPSTWAMMLLGFLGLGFAFRQSRRKVSFA
jgi:choice-of-anchor C domain-containing protein